MLLLQIESLDNFSSLGHCLLSDPALSPQCLPYLQKPASIRSQSSAQPYWRHICPKLALPTHLPFGAQLADSTKITRPRRAQYSEEDLQQNCAHTAHTNENNTKLTEPSRGLRADLERERANLGDLPHEAAALARFHSHSPRTTCCHLHPTPPAPLQRDRQQPKPPRQP